MMLNIFSQTCLNAPYSQVLVLSSKHELLYSQSGYKKTYFFDLETGAYILKIIIGSSCTFLPIYVSNKCKSFNYCYGNRLSRKLYILTDLHYSGLKIERGNLILKSIR